ncbi:hypothetical protein GQ44DRAFT_23835 [Phaeosphaeriaceae sp. PMI808]|nr:hypothetical protein GQ44DRAFT_23835 [Phaeosphaeriaceae sp. PMI808]
MKLFYLSILTLASASIIRRDWSCPTLINGCTKSYLVTSGTCESSGCYYCVAKDPIPDPCPTDYNSNCDKFYEVKTGDICWAIVGRNPPLSLNQLFEYNPSIHNPSCDNLKPNCKYCVRTSTPPKVPEPHQPNIKTNCKEYYQAVPGDYCYKISLEKGVNLNDFMGWNPDVGPTCLNMLAGYWYCLRI